MDTETRTAAEIPGVGTNASDVAAGLGSSRYKEYDIPGYAQVVRAHIPAEIWSGVFYSWLSLKGHLQGLHDFDRSEFFATANEDGDVDAVFAVVWAGAESLTGWLENGYPIDRVLANMGIPAENVSVQLMRDYS